ncbi:23S rRNA (guanosine(2251)-2'-O)-methyltransferase RlmB [Neomoorella mulderi]|uniref:Putative TrmH family tRNA/rRNA methyltransferase n=1 Tax=Moorella mulderi DSM 14980 TaxID=1122241 RepID=A0A151B1C1_9FIRM|nr:23S rRNA (guanosine(2251)-2'-O)-methyltransferase RlmB [Moorella mulderi]KYH33715.1 putative TrmH family tRNA/rRNA methyltransferase [Moorella mulderi DSM 14980]
MDDILAGRNPVREALRAGRPLHKILMAPRLEGRVIGEILALARSQGIPVQRVDRPVLDKMAGSRHQGVVALAAARSYAELEDLLFLAREKQEPPFLIMLDQVEDPHNLGAILRSAEAAGAHGIIIPRRRTAGLTTAVARAAAGALEYVPVARVTNLSQAIARLKAEGIWVIGAEGDGTKEAFATDFTIPLVLVFGSEGRGLSPLVRSHCDFTVRLPLRGRINSLNVAAAASVLMYEVVRQRYSCPV